MSSAEILKLFDDTPITSLAGFTFGYKSAVPTKQGRRTATFDQWWSAMLFAIGTEESSPFWIGDLWNWVLDMHPDWEDRVAAAFSEANWPISLKTLNNRGAISRAITGERRAYAQSVGHADVVAKLPPAEQEEWLDRSRTEEWPVRDLRRAIRASRRRAVIDGQMHLEGMYRVGYLDPPWPYKNSQPSGSKAESHYDEMPLESIASLPISDRFWDVCVLFCWVTAPTMLQNPGPRDVFDAWGMEYKQSLIWDKVRGGGGNYHQGNHEVLCILTRKGKPCVPDIQDGLPDSVHVEEKSPEHSEKPEAFRRLIDKHWPHGPRVELFGRAKVDGWVVLGDDASLWS